MGKQHACFRMRDYLRSGMQSSCHPCPRGRRHRARTSERWERDRDLVLVYHQTFASRAVLGSSRWVQLLWTVKRLSCGPIVVGLALPILPHKPDAKLRSSPSLLAPAGAYVQAVQRLAEGSPVTASLPSLTACGTCESELLLDRTGSPAGPFLTPHTLLETGVHQCFHRLCAHLPLGENDALRGLVTSERLDFFDTLGRSIGDVTEVCSRAENLKHLCLMHLFWARSVDKCGIFRHLQELFLVYGILGLRRQRHMKCHVLADTRHDRVSAFHL